MIGAVVWNQVIFYDSLLDYMNVQFGNSKHKICVVSINEETNKVMSLWQRLGMDPKVTIG